VPARNFDNVVEKFIARFYPGISGAERGRKSGEVRAWLHTTLSSYPSGLPTRKLEALYAAEHKADPGIKARVKLGESKKAWDYYVVKGVEIVAGPFVNKLEAGEVADCLVEGDVITSTEARRKGYLAVYLESRAVQEVVGE